MTRLSDTQTIILSRAAQNTDLIALPLPESLRGGAAAKMVRALLAKGLLEEVEADMRKGDLVWRETGDGHGVTLAATDAGLVAIGIEPENMSTAPTDAIEADSAPKAHAPRAGTKQAKLIEMLRADGGATIDEIAATLEWAPHTVRGAFSGALKKRLGLTITSEMVESRGRVYRLA